MGEPVDQNATIRSTLIDHLELGSAQGNSSTTITIENLLQLDLRSETGRHIYFMPKIEKNLEFAQQVCQDLSEKFFIPPFFFKEIGWNANGFFGSLDNQMQGPEEKSHSTFSRFLTKEVSQKPDIEYEWQFLGFCTFWRPGSQEVASELQVLLCFDLVPTIQDSVSQALQQQNLENVEGDPFALLKVITGVVVEQFDHALWTFRPVVRDFEKTRTENTRLSRVHQRDEVSRHEELVNLIKRYTDMHEVSRHVIHISETLTVASKTMLAIVAAHETFSKESNMQGLMINLSGSKRIGQNLQFSANLLANLQVRAQAFVDRLENEIQLAFNLVAAVDSSNSTGILDQTRNDARTLTDTISVLTLLFLPGTFISGFFGMSFFSLSPSSDCTSKWFVSNKLYIFFVCTVPITTIALILFIAEVPVIEWVRTYISRPLLRIFPKLKQKWNQKSVVASSKLLESSLENA